MLRFSSQNKEYCFGQMNYTLRKDILRLLNDMTRPEIKDSGKISITDPTGSIYFWICHASLMVENTIHS